MTWSICNVGEAELAAADTRRALHEQLGPRLLLRRARMLLTCIAVWIDSPGASPVFSQLRVGRNGKLFRLYKFRPVNAAEPGQRDGRPGVQDEG